LELKGFRLSKTKTEYMRCGFSTTRHKEEEVSLGQPFDIWGQFCKKDGNIDEDVSH
jgi:hypothetical protein